MLAWPFGAECRQPRVASHCSVRRPTPGDLLDAAQSKKKNRTHITDKLEKNSVDEHWEVMLDEILAEVESGRMNGPYQAPDWWPVPSVALRKVNVAPCCPCLTPTLTSQWPSASNKPAATATEVKTGDDADTMRLVLCMISLHHTPELTLDAHCQSGATIMMAHTANDHFEILAKPTCCYSRRKARRCGATTSSCLGRQQVSGHTIDSAIS